MLPRRRREAAPHGRRRAPPRHFDVLVYINNVSAILMSIIFYMLYVIYWLSCVWAPNIGSGDTRADPAW